MGWYLLKLCIMLPAIALLIWGSLKLVQKSQSGFGRSLAKKSATVLESIALSPTQRLLVVEFHGRHILIGATRQGLVRLCEAQSPPSENEQ